MYVYVFIILYHPYQLYQHCLNISPSYIRRICSGDTIAVVLLVTMGNTVRRRWTSVCLARASTEAPALTLSIATLASAPQSSR